MRGQSVPDEPERDEVVRDELLVVLPRLFKLEHEHQELVAPVCRLHEVVALELGLHVPVRVVCERR